MSDVDLKQGIQNHLVEKYMRSKGGPDFQVVTDIDNANFRRGPKNMKLKLVLVKSRVYACKGVPDFLVVTGLENMNFRCGPKIGNSKSSS